MFIDTKNKEQENFWKEDFGDDYITRNKAPELIASNLALFSKVLARAEKVGSCCEFGANIGLNILALKQLLPYASFDAVEINEKACVQLKAIPDLTVHHGSFLDYKPQKLLDMVLIKGVLIHQNPAVLKEAYQQLYNSSKRYILIAEYYNPIPVAIEYRGHHNKLFKRDFAGEMMDYYPDLTLRDYGFLYARDPMFPESDSTWFLLEKE
jgi:pseudaminic acid biosynthesis-associated methylase